MVCSSNMLLPPTLSPVNTVLNVCLSWTALSTLLTSFTVSSLTSMCGFLNRPQGWWILNASSVRSWSTS